MKMMFIAEEEDYVQIIITIEYSKWVYIGHPYVFTVSHTVLQNTLPEYSKWVYIGHPYVFTLFYTNLFIF
jgi:hypothetical protein